jgi:hypothetical protein
VQQWASRRRRFGDGVEALAVDSKSRPRDAAHALERRCGSADVDRHRDRAGLPDAEQRAEIGGPVAHDDVHRLVRGNVLPSKGALHIFGRCQQKIG